MPPKNVRLAVLALALLGLITGCGGGSGGVVVGGDYPVAYVDRAVAAAGDGTNFVPGGDLYLRELASPSARARNITREYTQGEGDVASPNASYDGRRLVFSMRGPDDPSWNIWEYSLDSRSLRRIIADDELANAGDDLDPHYLPDGRIVFTSNRQSGSRAQLEESGVEPFSYADGYNRKAALVLHVMDADGGGIEQISFNQSHDRSPSVRMNGEIMYARWDHMGNRNQQPIFTMQPDGRQVDVLYGAFSPGDSFLHPRELPDGRVISTVLPLAGVRNGGALVIADVSGHTDHARRLDGSPGAGQHQPTLYELPLGRVTSPYGRYTTPYPLWDGSSRVLVAWSAQQRGGTPSPTVSGETEPRYGIYMLDLKDRSMRLIASAAQGRILTDPVAMMPRPLPATLSPAAIAPTQQWGVAPRPYPEPDPKPECPKGVTPKPFPNPPDDCEPEPDPECPKGISPKPYPKPPDECEPDPKPDPDDPDPEDPDPNPDPEDPGPIPQPEPSAILNIRSVYDTDFLDSMGDSMLVAGESIPLNAAGEPDLVRLRDASLTTADERPARFLRVSRALPVPPGFALDGISGTSFKMQQLLGYAPIEPDGSVRVEVPADTPLSLAVVDARGRAFQTHTSWLQTRPGEERTCNGCHSADRGSEPLNTGSLAGGPFEGSVASLSAYPGETMAETRTRIDEDALQLRSSPFYRDVWTDPVTAGRAADQEFSLPYPSGVAISDGIIDYAQHIQPIWEERNCVSCHGPGSSMDLSDTIGPSGRMQSYDNLVLGRPVADRATQRQGRVVIEREMPVVNVGGSANSSRTSYLIELLSGEELLAPQSLSSAFDHSSYVSVSDSELRLIAEWIDLGAAYRNALPTELGAAAQLDRDYFTETVHPLLRSRCLSCHLPHANSGEIDEPNHRNPNYAPNRFALTGNPETDFGAAAAMVNDACNATASSLLARPSSTESSTRPHPSIIRGDRDDTRGPMLHPGDAGYTRLLEWIGTGCR